MYKPPKIILFFLLIGVNLFAQTSLKISPETVRFKNIFNRYEYALLINIGNQVLQIDSIAYKNSFYLLDFENGQQLPISINPSDTLKLNITLANFYNISLTDTTDTIFVYSNASVSHSNLKIKIDFFDDEYGTCAGIITDELSNPIINSKVYFFYYGVYLFDSTYTDATGNYSSRLPKGNYTICAEKDGYHLMFSGNTPDPFFAQSVNFDSNKTVIVNLMLPGIVNTGHSVSGNILNPLSNSTIKNGIVVVRKGTHTPTLLKADSTFAPFSVYAGIVKKDGSYNIAVEDTGYYYVQGYSSYFLPAYFNIQNSSSVFWQGADSVLLNSQQSNKNLYLVRDSSYGAGNVYGKILMPLSGNNNFEGITLLAKSIFSGNFYSYNFSKEDGTYSVNNLPYGSYQIVAQKIGYDNAISDTFTIDALNPNHYNINFSFIVADVANEIIIPEELRLNPNYPNPFNPSTTISFSLPKAELVRIKVYNILGEQVAELSNDIFNAGTHKILFNANGLSSGIYIVTLETKSTRLSQKIALLK